MSGVVWIGEANDFMSGGAGGDFYIYERGDGEDVIDDSGAFSFGAACNDNDGWPEWTFHRCGGDSTGEAA